MSQCIIRWVLARQCDGNVVVKAVTIFSGSLLDYARQVGTYCLPFYAV
jgi:hypothetical protein